MTVVVLAMVSSLRIFANLGCVYDHEELELDAVKPKCNDQKSLFFQQFCLQLQQLEDWNVGEIENAFKELAAAMSIKPGELQLPMRIMLVGGKFGPAVFEIASLIGKNETIDRIHKAIVKIETNE